ncbi:MAG TPA: ATP synthase F0 subunit A, partial [Maribacter sp.]|nr:ATP synthase F0 subunit A [Maribacter sp.]
MQVSNTFKTLLQLLILCFSMQSFAFSDTEQEGAVSTKEQVDEYILHHLKDSHDFHLFSYSNDAGERKHVGFPLPVILWSNNGLATFMSSEFHHDDNGQVIVERNGSKFVKLHSKIYELDNGASSVSFDE